MPLIVEKIRQKAGHLMEKICEGEAGEWKK